MLRSIFACLARIMVVYRPFSEASILLRVQHKWK